MELVEKQNVFFLKWLKTCVTFKKKTQPKFGYDWFCFVFKARMAGREVDEHFFHHDLVIEKQATAGRVTFTDVRILDVFSNLRLNVTMTQTPRKLVRIPNINQDYKSLYLVNASTGSAYYRYKMIRPIDPSLMLSKRFNVTGN